MISWSTVNVPGVGEAANLIALVALNVVAEAADPPDVGSLNNATLLKSFAAETSEPDPDSTPSNEESE